MDSKSFKESLSQDSIPAGLNLYLQSLWYDAKNDWVKSHAIIQDVEGTTAAWIHAYLHRKEGDLWNADYWYERAGRKRPSASLQEEWNTIATYCLQQQTPD